LISVVYLRSFDRSMEALPVTERRRAVEAIDKLLDYFGGGAKPLGLGLRKLRKDYWEVRAGLDKRVLFSLHDDTATFIVVGNHDEIRRLIRQ
jgi:mRNA-degrading endonuclease RelE of RelBE toxin-antitoxin system